jgi:hypothetical protein
LIQTITLKKMMTRQRSWTGTEFLAEFVGHCISDYASHGAIAIPVTVDSVRGSTVRLRKDDQDSAFVAGSQDQMTPISSSQIRTLPTGQAQPSLVLAERAVEDFPRSTRAIRDGLGLPLKMRRERRAKVELTITVLDNH